MGLLSQIQESVIQDGVDLGSVLLKLRLLAARLGSDCLEEWVKHESEGYPKDVDVPPYRVVGVSYRGTFSGPFGAGIQNAPIPPYLITKYANASWVEYKMRESIAGVDELIKMSADGDGTLGIDASNLILLLQGNIYPQYACNEIRGTISRTSISEIKQKVRTRILELTLELEKSAPSAASISLGAIQVDEAHIEQVERISQHIIYGNVTTINSGNGSNINLQIGERDSVGLIDYLVKSGIPEKDASELAEIMASEGPTCPDEPLGDNAKNWLADNLKKAAKGTWNIGITIATKVVSEAALKYYGLK